MFTAGLGLINDNNLQKMTPVEGDLIIKVGGPVYRSGLGGGAASSSDNTQKDRDTSAVQREDPQMEQKMNRVIQACLERTPNPIKTIHDQGAGGNANVLKEIIETTGGIIHLDRLTLGDETLTPLEMWIAEYQESNAFVISPDSLEWVQNIN